MKIYHLALKTAWRQALASGSYTADSLEAEGFIHCSTAEQIVPVAWQFYRGQTDLVLLVIEVDRLKVPVKWERSAPPPGLQTDSVFPHVYGPILTGAVSDVLDFEPNESGGFALPPAISEHETGHDRGGPGVA